MSRSWLKCGALAMFFYTSFSCSMDQSIVVRQAGMFDSLPEEIYYPIFAPLSADDKNKVGKTCKLLRQLLLFENAPKLIFCKNFSASWRDITCLLTAAAFNGSVNMVQRLLEINGEYPYPFYQCMAPRSSRLEHFDSPQPKMGLSCAKYFLVNPSAIACWNSCPQVREELKKYSLNKKQLVSDYFNKVFVADEEPSLLVACIARDRQAIKEAISGEKFNLNPNKMKYYLSVVIDNDDVESLAIMIGNQKIREYIKKQDYDFLNLAIVSGRKGAAELLLTSKCFDVNEIIKKDYFKEGIVSPFKGTYLDFVNSLREEDMPSDLMLQILKKNGAKTHKELEESLIFNWIEDTICKTIICSIQ